MWRAGWSQMSGVFWRARLAFSGSTISCLKPCQELKEQHTNMRYKIIQGMFRAIIKGDLCQDSHGQRQQWCVLQHRRRARCSMCFVVLVTNEIGVLIFHPVWIESMYLQGTYLKTCTTKSETHVSWSDNYFQNATPVKKSRWSLFSEEEVSVLLSLAAAEWSWLGCEGRLSTGSFVWIVRTCNLGIKNIFGMLHVGNDG